jgi:ribosomal-protein-alanine N-acetyltransferase
VPRFATEHLRVEPLALDHADELAALHADARVMATMGGTGTAEESHAWLVRNLRHGDEAGFGVFVFREHVTGTFVGRGAVRRLVVGGHREVEIGYALAAEMWGRGLATEMARWLVAQAAEHGIVELVAYTEPTNAPSRRVLVKVGFAYERDIEYHGRPQVLYRWRRTP